MIENPFADVSSPSLRRLRAMPCSLEVHILGPVRVIGDDRDFGVHRPLERAVLVRLAMARGAPVPDARLITDLWGGASLPRPLQRLRVLISRLRTTLGEHGAAIIRSPAGYRTNVAVTDLIAAEAAAARIYLAQRNSDDAAVCSAAEDALCLWRGPTLIDLPPTPFVVAEAARFDQWRLDLTIARMDATVRLGSGVETATELAALVREHPQHEPLTRLYALTLYRNGNQADALDQLQRLRRALSDQLGIDPTPETVELELRILRHDQSLQPPRRLIVLAGDNHRNASAAPTVPGTRGTHSRHLRAKGIPMGDSLFADVSYFQAPVDDSYPYGILSFRSNDGTFRDPNFDANYTWACRAVDSGRLACFIVYFYWRPAWFDTADIHRDMVTRAGGPHPGMIAMIDVESGGNPAGDQSDGINRAYWYLVDWLGDARRVIGYANTGDLFAMWGDRPPNLRLIGAGYGRNPNLPGQIAHQYTDGNGYGGGLPEGCPPFGNCDMNVANGLSPKEFAAACGIGIEEEFMTALNGDEQRELLEKIRDIWTQLRGPDGKGWPQLGRNEQGTNPTPVDALAAVEQAVQQRTR